MTLDNELHLQLYAIAPAPCRDYYGLTITNSQVILNIWNISHGPHIYPKRHKALLEDFNEEKFIQNEIRRIFGEHVLNFCRHFANRDKNLQYLPTKLFLGILRHLAAKDILSLSETSKIFFEICNTDAVWKIIFRKKLRRPIIRDDYKIAEDIGWKKMLMNKFTKRFDIKRKPLKTSTLESKNKNNSSNASACKKNNIDVIQNIKRSNFPKVTNDVIYIKELSTKDTRKKCTSSKNVTFENVAPIVNSKMPHSTHNVPRNLNITGNSIRNYINNPVSRGNLSSKTATRITPKKQ